MEQKLARQPHKLETTVQFRSIAKKDWVTTTLSGRTRVIVRSEVRASFLFLKSGRTKPTRTILLKRNHVLSTLGFQL